MSKNKEDILYGRYLKSWVTQNRRICWDRKEKRKVAFSHFVWNLYNPKDVICFGDGYLIHHKDENTLNDHPYNLKKKLRGKHSSEHNKGKVLSKEHRKNISNAKKGTTKGEKNPMYGRKHREETKKNWSKNRKGKYLGKNHPNWKGGISQSYKRKMSLVECKIGKNWGEC